LGFVRQKGHKHANRPVAVGLILTLAAVFIAYSNDVAAGDMRDLMRYSKVDDTARRRMMEVGYLTANPAAFPPAASYLLLASP
jgi:hypothetical protein